MGATLIFIGIAVAVVLFTMFMLMVGESEDKKDPMILEKNDSFKKEDRSDEVSVEVNNPSSNDNPIARILLVVGILEIIAGFICGIVFSQVEVQGYIGKETEFNITVFFTWFISTLVSGLLIIGFSEVIRLLSSINYKTDRYLIEEQREVS